MVFSQNLLYACTMKTIPAIETNRPTKKISGAETRMLVASRKIADARFQRIAAGNVIYPVLAN
jgi:hypothetical protein